MVYKVSISERHMYMALLINIADLTFLYNCCVTNKVYPPVNEGLYAAVLQCGPLGLLLLLPDWTKLNCESLAR